MRPLFAGCCDEHDLGASEALALVETVGAIVRANSAERDRFDRRSAELLANRSEQPTADPQPPGRRSYSKHLQLTLGLGRCSTTSSRHPQ